MNSRLCWARSASSRRRQAGSIFKKVYLTKWRWGIAIQHRPRCCVVLAEPVASTRIRSMGHVRVALVSPYSWTYPGGVTRHIEALAGQLTASGHDVRVLAPFDAD